MTVLLCYLISGLFFGYGGWGFADVYRFYRFKGAEVDTSFVHAVPQWLYMLMQSGTRLVLRHDRSDSRFDGIGSCPKYGGKHRHDDGSDYCRNNLV